MGYPADRRYKFIFSFTSLLFIFIGMVPQCAGQQTSANPHKTKLALYRDADAYLIYAILLRSANTGYSRHTC
jgi:hypothetical protein